MTPSDATTAAALLLLAVLVAAARRADLLAALASAEPAPVAGDQGDEQGQGGAALDLAAALAPLDLTPTMTDTDQAARNVAAFLLMIRTAEGTAGPDGYRTMFGGDLFTDYSDHPRRAVQFGPRRLWTSAAGAFQFMAVSPLPGGGFTKVDTWDRLARRLALPDFSPASQDAAAVELIREAGALGLVQSGRFAEAVAAVRLVWASLPGAGYGQPERRLEFLQAAYLNAGGAVA